MGKKKFTDQAFLDALKSFRDERRSLVNDSLKKSVIWSDLYEGLYENKNASLRKIEFERYELLTLKRHWESAITKFEQLPETEYYDDLKIFVRAYRSYAYNMGITALGMDFIGTYLKAIDKLLETNRNWELNLKNLHGEFLKGEKIFNDLLKNYDENAYKEEI